MDFEALVRVRPVPYDKVDRRFMSLQTRLQNTVTSYLLFQALLFLSLNLDAFSIQSRFWGVSLFFSLFAATASFHVLILDLFAAVQICLRLDLHDNVVTQIHTADLRERTRLVRVRDFRRYVGAGVLVAVLTVFEAVMLVACWLIVPVVVVLEEAVESAIRGSVLGGCSGPGQDPEYNMTNSKENIWFGSDLFSGGFAAPGGACKYNQPEASYVFVN